MERSTVHIAVLVVAEDPATVDLASATFMSDKATSAGHRIVAQEIVEDDETAIRDQLARWIGQPHIDVVLSAGADDAASVALGPLVTKPLPGLTDQLRLLARDRGSSARPVAARCASKFVFLLPSEVAALGAALNQLVLPQLDSTAERNLVKDMPRHGGEAVPQPVAAEKTVTGAGLAPKVPAEPRGKRKTGANIVARNEARQAGINPQDQTRQIDREKLEQQLARSANPSHDAPTRPHIDLATMLPPVPPGASDRADTDEDLAALDPSTLDDPTMENPTAPAVRTVQPARLRGPSPIGTAKVPSVKPLADEAPTTRAAPRVAGSGPVAAKPAASTPVAAKPVASAPVASKPVASTPAVAKPVASTPVASKPAASTPAVAKPAASVSVPSVIPRPAASAPAAAASAPAGSAKELPKPTPVAGVTTATPATGTRTPVAPRAEPSNGQSRSPANGQRPAASAPPIGEVRRADLEAAAAEADLDEESSADIIEAVSSANILEAASADFEEVSTPPSPSRVHAAPMIPAARPAASAPPAIPRPATGPAPVVPQRPATGPAPVVPQRPATGPAPVVPQRPATGPAPVVPQRPATGPAPIVATSAAPPQPFTGPELLDLREGTQKKRRSRTGTALVRENKRSSPLMYIALAGAAVAGFFAVVHFFPQITGGDQASPKGSAAVAMQAPGSDTAAPVGSAGPGSVAPAGSAEPVGSAEAAGSAVALGSAEPAGSAVPEEPAGSNIAAATHATASSPPAPHTHHSTGTVATAAPVTHPDTAKTDAAKTDAVKTDSPKPDVAKTDTAKTDTAAPPAEDGCDEVSCVMEHYERACCARFKPADSGFHPKGTVPDQLDRSMVKAGIEKVKPKVVACGEKVTAKGTVKLSITVSPEGNVSDISVVESPDDSLGACVMAAVKRAQFGKATSATSFNYPFVF